MRKLAALLLIAVACATTHPPVVKSTAEYDRLVAVNPDKRLVEITDIPRDVRYATTNNFMHQTLYPVAKVFLRRPAAVALTTWNASWRARGFGAEALRRLSSVSRDGADVEADPQSRFRRRSCQRVAPQSRRGGRSDADRSAHRR